MPGDDMDHPVSKIVGAWFRLFDSRKYNICLRIYGLKINITSAVGKNLEYTFIIYFDFDCNTIPKLCFLHLRLGMTTCMQRNTPLRIGRIQIGLITTSKYAPYTNTKTTRLKYIFDCIWFQVSTCFENYLLVLTKPEIIRRL